MIVQINDPTTPSTERLPKHHDALMGSAAEDFAYVTSAKREVRVLRDGQVVTVLRGDAADRFLAEVASGDPQRVMARVTGNYKRGNERLAKRHPRNRRL